MSLSRPALLSRGLLTRDKISQTLLAPRVASGAAPFLAPTDGPDSVYVPTATAHWTNLGLPIPTRFWTCQETSGNLVDIVAGLTLVPTATTPLYNQTVTGWTSKFVGTADSTSDQAFRTSDASLNMGTGVSAAVLVYMSWASATLNRRMVSQCGGNNLIRNGNATATRAGAAHNAVVTQSTNNHSDLTTVRPYVWYRDATANESGLRTNLEHLASTHDETAYTGVKSLGPPTATAAVDSRICLYAVWIGADAEVIKSAATLTTLGW